MLILTASIGEGHDLPARTLAEQLRDELPGVEVSVEDGLRAMGRAFVLVNEQGARIVFYRLQWIWDAVFWLSSGTGLTRAFTKWLVRLFGARGVLRLVDRLRPDVVVSVYPLTTEVLGGLRRSGRLEVPCVAAITDIAALHYWAAPGIDLHLLVGPELVEEVRAVAGRNAPAEVVHGLMRPEFAYDRDPADARRALELPAEGKVVLVSGGGWGVGDIGGAVEEALSLDTALVVCLCGRNERLRVRLERVHADEPRVRIVGFTEQMGDWIGGGRARALNGRLDSARGVHPRLPDDLIRVGSRAYPPPE